MQNPVSLIRMDSESMGRYVEFVADQLLSSLGCEKFYAAQVRPPGHIPCLATRMDSFVASGLDLKTCGFPANVCQKQNPFDWMEQQRRSTASASHQSAPVASDHASMMGSMGAGLTFAMDDDF
eukprot:SAG11_NODE_2480_length_3307_cov_3.206983_1_plen_123_part_00